MAELTATNQTTVKRDRGLIKVDEQECKGCGLCNEACPPHVIGMSDKFNHYGYRTAVYAGAGCTGCGVCFMVCPEPSAITVYVLDNANAGSHYDLPRRIGDGSRDGTRRQGPGERSGREQRENQRGTQREIARRLQSRGPHFL